jgi:hypothetical protein
MARDESVGGGSCEEAGHHGGGWKVRAGEGPEGEGGGWSGHGNYGDCDAWAGDGRPAVEKKRRLREERGKGREWSQERGKGREWSQERGKGREWSQERGKGREWSRWSEESVVQGENGLWFQCFC